MRTIIAAILGFIVGTFAEQYATNCNHDKIIAQAFNAGYRTRGIAEESTYAERIGN